MFGNVAWVAYSCTFGLYILRDQVKYRFPDDRPAICQSVVGFKYALGSLQHAIISRLVPWDVVMHLSIICLCPTWIAGLNSVEHDASRAVDMWIEIKNHYQRPPKRRVRELQLLLRARLVESVHDGKQIVLSKSQWKQQQLDA